MLLYVGFGLHPKVPNIAAYAKISNFQLEYKQGDVWTPILTGEKAMDYSVVKDFPTVSSQAFRLTVLESDIPAKIRDVELLPPL